MKQINRDILTKITEETDVRASKLVETAGITLKEAERTVLLFPDIRQAMVVANGYHEMPEGRYENYAEFLNHIKHASLDTSYDLFQEEVQKRTSLVSKEQLLRHSYRDDPKRSSHFYEHLASQDRT